MSRWKKTEWLGGWAQIRVCPVLSEGSIEWGQRALFMRAFLLAMGDMGPVEDRRQSEVGEVEIVAASLGPPGVDPGAEFMGYEPWLHGGTVGEVEVAGWKGR